jgi:hypothetical protein
MRGDRAAMVGALVVAAGGCALAAGYDFGKWGKDPGDGGTGATGGSTSSAGTLTTGSSAAKGSSTGATTSTAASSSSGACNGSIAGQTPTVFTDPMVDVVSVAADNQFVFWTESVASTVAAKVRRTDKNASTTVDQTLAGESMARGLVLDVMNAYWITTTMSAPGETIWKIVKSFSAGAVQLASTTNGSYGGIAVQNGVVYFIYTPAIVPDAGMPAGIYSVPTVGGTPKQVVPLAGLAPTAIAADGSAVYVALQATMEIIKWDLMGNMLMTLVGAQAGVQGLALDATHLYWSSATTIARIPKAGGAVEPVGIANNAPCAGMLIDDPYFFCTSNNTGGVLEIGLSSWSTTTIKAVGMLPGVTPLRGVGADCNAVYFADGTKIGKIPRL